MLADVVGLLRCPRCAQPVAAASGALRCAGGHAFDVARQGYVNLLGTSPPGSADTAAMVAARHAFLGAGHYAALADAVAEGAGTGDGPVVEVGAGTGYYLTATLDRRPRSVGVALDASVPASRRAARAHPRAGAVVADAWGSLPLVDGCADVVLVVFAPRGGAEIARVLRPGGRLVVLTPTPDHLRELVGPLGLLGVGGGKTERLRASLDPWFEAAAEVDVRRSLDLSSGDVELLAAMGPSAFHTTDEQRRQRVAALTAPVRVTVSVTVTVLRRPMLR